MTLGFYVVFVPFVDYATHLSHNYIKIRVYIDLT